MGKRWSRCCVCMFHCSQVCVCTCLCWIFHSPVIILVFIRFWILQVSYRHVTGNHESQWSCHTWKPVELLWLFIRGYIDSWGKKSTAGLSSNSQLLKKMFHLPTTYKAQVERDIQKHEGFSMESVRTDILSLFLWMKGFENLSLNGLEQKHHLE